MLPGLYVLVASITNSGTGESTNKFLSLAVIIFMKCAYLEEQFKTCILYSFSTGYGCYDDTVNKTGSRVCAAKVTACGVPVLCQSTW